MKEEKRDYVDKDFQVSVLPFIRYGLWSYHKQSFVNTVLIFSWPIQPFVPEHGASSTFLVIGS